VNIDAAVGHPASVTHRSRRSQGGCEYGVETPRPAKAGIVAMVRSCVKAAKL
jgi:hypothetical protein